jgi:serine/threonine protein kinase/tetratricopeptide (TPR) repeat protein
VSPPPGDAAPARPPSGPTLPQTVILPSLEGLEAIARAYREFCAQGGPEDAAAAERWCFSVRGDVGQAFRDVHRTVPAAAARLAAAAAEMPRPGQQWLGFEILDELGRGTFGRVFLARQGDLAGRLVALKVSADLFGETQTLALLQHTNIVPIYSAHRSGALQALCMPYFGATTLADLLGELGSGQSLPESGRALVGTLHQHRDSTRRSHDRPSPPWSPSRRSAEARAGDTPPRDAPAVAPPPGPRPEAVFERLKRLNYVNAILWIGTRLAEGLEHAHERGIVHRDLKPANVLITDEGQPMLLDFSLSDNTHFGGPAVARLGGTLPYMAPEHLAALSGGPAPAVDPRCDIYSLGVILFQLLTGRHPFETPRTAPDDLLERMLAERRAVPSIRRWNDRVSPAVESIVRHCLETDPARRYQSASQLVEDLERQRADLPLRHAPEPSLGERAAKWVRRRPRLAAATLVAVAVAAVCAVPAAWLSGREARLHRAARETREAFDADRLAAERLLNRPAPGRDDLEAGTRSARSALARYAVFDGPGWRQASEVTRLAEGDRRSLAAEVEDLLLLLARALTLQADDDRGRRDELVHDALALNALAEGEGDGRPFSRAGWLQRADLAKLQGDEPGEALARRQAAGTSPRTARDHYLLGRELMARREYREALPQFRSATDLDPRLFWAWYCQGACQFELRQDVEALQCYRAGLAVWPDAYELRVGRALVFQRQGRREQAAADFDEAVRVRPESPEVYVHRAALYCEMDRPADAARDLDRALGLDGRQTRAWFLRSEARRKLGDAAGADGDLWQALRLEPSDPVGWATRGWARIQTDPKAALDDFDRALRLNPRYLPALQDKAYVLADVLRKNDEALAALDREVALFPDYVPARIGRGVLRARVGRVEEARADVRACLELSNEPATLYQAANVYALTSARVAEDRARALNLLTTALRGGFGMDLVETDPDFAPLRDDPEFRKCVEAARTLRAPPADAAR